MRCPPEGGCFSTGICAARAHDVRIRAGAERCGWSWRGWRGQERLRIFFLSGRERFAPFFVVRGGGAVRETSLQCGREGWGGMTHPCPAGQGCQSADKAHNRKNRSDKIKIRSDFCFRRQQNLHPAVTYVYVSSLDGRVASLACGLSRRSTRLVNILNASARQGTGRFALPASPDAERSKRPRPQKLPCWTANPLLCRTFPARGHCQRPARPVNAKASRFPASAGGDGALCVSVRCAPRRFPWAAASRGHRLRLAARRARSARRAPR